MAEKTAARTGEAKQKYVTGSRAQRGEGTHSNSRQLAAHFGAPPFLRCARRKGSTAVSLGTRPQAGWDLLRQPHFAWGSSPAGRCLSSCTRRLPRSAGAGWCCTADVVARRCGYVDSSMACFVHRPRDIASRTGERALGKRGNSKARFPSTWRWQCLPAPTRLS